jgi:hypothetical protein
MILFNPLKKKKKRRNNDTTVKRGIKLPRFEDSPFTFLAEVRLRRV